MLVILIFKCLELGDRGEYGTGFAPGTGIIKSERDLRGDDVDAFEGLEGDATSFPLLLPFPPLPPGPPIGGENTPIPPLPPLPPPFSPESDPTRPSSVVSKDADAS